MKTHLFHKPDPFYWPDVYTPPSRPPDDDFLLGTPPDGPIRRVFYRPELDALRFFAFLSVFISHVVPRQASFYSGLHLPPVVANFCAGAVLTGRSGVVLFFMLSSFLITGLLLREKDRAGRIDLLSFYKRRALRIWPLYYSFVFVCLLILPLFGAPVIPLIDVSGFLFFFENWASVFRNELPHTVAGPLWSISVEEQFYLLWPVLIMVLGVRRIWILCISCIIIAPMARAAMHTETGVWLSTFSHIDSIAVGAWLAYAIDKRPLPRLIGIARLALVGTGIVMIVFSQYLPDLWRYPVVTVACLFGLIGVYGFTMPQGVVASLLVYLGKISFGLYVFHEGYIWWMDLIYPKFAFVLPASLFCTVVSAVISYHWLEMPFLRLKEKLAVVASRAP